MSETHRDRVRAGRKSSGGWNSPGFRLLRVTLIIGGIAGLSVFLTWPTSLVRRAELLLSDGRSMHALNLALSGLDESPESSHLLLIAGKAAFDAGQLSPADRFLSRVPEQDWGFVDALSIRGTIALVQGRAADAERFLSRVIEVDPSQSSARTELVKLLLLEGRDWEAKLHLPPLYQSASGDARFLALSSLLAQGEGSGEKGDVEAFVDNCRKSVPSDLLPQFAIAQRNWRQNRTVEAQAFAEQIVAQHPNVIDPQALLGELLVEQGNDQAYLQWNQQLPTSAEQHPGVWFSRGVWARSKSQPACAARCFLETLLRDPHHLSANHQMSQVLAQLNRPDEAQAFARFTDKLRRTLRLLDDPVLMANDDRLREAVNLLIETGRLYEAAAWCQIAQEMLRSSVSWPSEKLRRLSPQLPGLNFLAARSNSPAFLINVNQFPLPELRNNSQTSEPRPAVVSRRIRFDDEAAQKGLDFVYINGASSSELESLLEMDGGGIGVLDFDRDGWPDLYFTQGGPMPVAFPDAPALKMTEAKPADRLFRNFGGTSFVEVARLARVGDEGYGQGTAVGDFDNDGFPDLYVANAGPNCFFRNNGDGTFSDVTEQTSTGGNQWTSCAVLADLNGDSLPDLFLVNYIQLESMEMQRCERRAATRCVPANYPAAHDQLYLNQGDGRFEECTEAAGLTDPDGRGLGVVAADFDDSGRISLYVANDATANFFFLNEAVDVKESTDPADVPHFREIGWLNGTAFDENGRPQSSMGIGVGDSNGDGLLDLFVTNFYQESNTLYRMQPDKSFSVQTRAANLRDGSYLMLGWGTQFLDADLDGQVDLVLANGHVHQPTHSATPYQMPAQFYKNANRGKFELLSSQDVGPYFARQLLGRSLVSLDWNRDGLMDVCIGHLDTPVALLTNHSEEVGRFLSIRLIGIEGNRDAVGAKIRVQAGGIMQTGQLVAGDGFQCSKEKKLVFGIDRADTVEEIQISWPGGRIQVFQDLVANQELVFVEGNERPYRLAN